MVKSRSEGPEGTHPEDADRRVRATPEPLALDQAEVDPTLGTHAWTLLADTLEADKAAGYGGALLVIDLDRQSSALAARTGENRNEILPLLADALRRAVRSSDLMAHLEDFRFAVLLRGAPLEIAQSVAQRVLESVGNTVFWLSEGLAPLSVEVGGALFDKGTPGASTLLHSATANLQGAGASATRTLIG
jgi:GGDEF domain-containing protein